jgi:hypothetical protein
MKKADPGFIVGALVMICAALLGFMPMALFAALFQLFAIYIGYIFFYSKSSGAFDPKQLTFFTWCWLSSTVICIILEGGIFGGQENSIINSLSVVRQLDFPGIGNVWVFNTDFFGGLAKILTWDYSFYTGSWVFLKIMWLILLTPGMVWSISQFFVSLLPSVISIFRPGISR